MLRRLYPPAYSTVGARVHWRRAFRFSHRPGSLRNIWYTAVVFGRRHRFARQAVYDKQQGQDLARAPQRGPEAVRRVDRAFRFARGDDVDTLAECDKQEREMPNTPGNPTRSCKVLPTTSSIPASAVNPVTTPAK
jgi:hypothetical protein